jgi:hypothetical protein
MTKDQEYLKWQHIIENHHLSTQGFLDCRVLSHEGI